MKKIPVITPLFCKIFFLTYFKEQTDLFNSNFTKKCSLIRDVSKLATSSMLYETIYFLLIKTVQNLNPYNLTTTMISAFAKKVAQLLADR